MCHAVFACAEPPVMTLAVRRVKGGKKTTIQ